MSQFTSTMIDDEDLIEELRRYGEKNLPTLVQPGERVTKRSNHLTDQNREIYLKKLNHYRAREKAEQNPSKYLKQQTGLAASTSTFITDDLASSSSSNTSSQVNNKKNSRRSSTRFKLENNIYYDHEEDEDVVEIGEAKSGNDTTCEYVKVSNAHTSPLSTSTYNQTNMTSFNDDDEHDDYLGGAQQGGGKYTANHIMSSTQLPSVSNNPTNSNRDINYVSLKEKIELDKTLSKYRSEIQNLITGTIIKNRNTNNSQSSALNDVVYTGTTYNKPVKIEPTISTNTIYCPKAKTKEHSFFDTLKSTFTRSNNTNQTEDLHKDKDSPYYNLSQIRGGHADLRNRLGKSEKPTESGIKKTIPVKENPAIWTQISTYFQQQISPAFSNLSMHVSKLLPYIIIIIFTIISMEYVRVKFYYTSDLHTPNPKSAFDQSFQPSADSKPAHFYCWDIKDTQCVQTKTLVREVIDYLRAKSGQIDCSPLGGEASKANVPPHGNSQELGADFVEKCVHVNTAVNYLVNERKLIKNRQFQSEAVSSVLSAVQKNPHWNIRLLNANYMDTLDLSQVTYMMSTVSSKPMFCRFKELLHFLYVRIIMVASLALALVTGFLVVRTVRRINAERDTQFFDLVSKVTNLVEKNYESSLMDASGNSKPFVAISHVFDTLIAANERAGKKKLWSRVIKFIEDHESRIHLETQFIDGEETLVWKWVVPKNQHLLQQQKQQEEMMMKKMSENGIGLANSTMLPTSPENKLYPSLHHHHHHHQDILTQDCSNGLSGRTVTLHQHEELKENNPSHQMNSAWQGDAFNRSEKLVHSPTPCLKIRNMFDQAMQDGDVLFAQRIHNDILEKCCASRNPVTGKLIVINHFILHISCDKKSKEGCVYVKCNGNESAGRVYQALNGTWYNGKLLNVKFLRSDRYLERFPESVNYVKPLQTIQM